MSTPSLKTAQSIEPRSAVEQALESLEQVIVGKRDPLRLCVACMVAKGHLLIEDVPGVGKTTLAHALAKVMGLSYQRIQFTSDLLPADVIGVSVFHRDRGQFEFHRGPVFSQLVLADEINRATPKAQSALLEAMEERQVTADGECLPLPEPFFVIATRNPSTQVGTFPLPESQLDRFLMQISLGYPDPENERALLISGDRRELIKDLAPALDANAFFPLQVAASQVLMSGPLLDYVQALLAYSRNCGAFNHGLSPRGGIALVRSAQAWALLNDHKGVHPEDVQTVLHGVVAHRLEPNPGSGIAAGKVADHLIDAVPIP
jgi:MoxR-like ATPase